MAIMEISVVPIGTGSTSVGKYVAEMQKLLSSMDISFQLHDMGTTVEGKMDQIIEAAKKLHETPFLMGAKRVYTVIKIDDRRDKKVLLGEKTSSVKEKLI